MAFIHPTSSPARRATRTWRLGAQAALLAACAITAAGCAQPTTNTHASVAAPAVSIGPVHVGFADPTGFDQDRHSPMEGEKTRLAWMNALGRHLAEGASARLPEGQRLDVRITDVQRAGGFEPWRTQSDVRIVRDIYPPRIDLEFRLLAADGSTLRSGTRQLRDSAFLMRASTYTNDPLRYEKALLDDWLRKELPDVPARPRR